MVYFVFAGLFLAGGILSFVLFRTSYAVKNATVLESRERISCKENEFRRIILQHAIECTDDPGNVIITDVLPVHEPDGAKIRIKIDKKTGKPVKTTHFGFMALPLSMLLAAAFCLIPGFAGIIPSMQFLKDVLPTEREMFSCGMVFVFAAVIVIYMLVDLLSILDPAVVKVKGKYEGFMHSDTTHRLISFYSLWYGEYRQYAICTGAPLKKSADTKEHTLYYNTIKGTVKRKADIIRNACFAVVFAGAFAGLYAGMML